MLCIPILYFCVPITINTKTPSLKKWINSTVVAPFAVVLAKCNNLLRLFSVHYKS